MTSDQVCADESEREYFALEIERRNKQNLNCKIYFIKNFKEKDYEAIFNISCLDVLTTVIGAQKASY